MIKSEPYYWVVCDRCGERADYGDWSALADASQAVDLLDEYWIKIQGRKGELHYCVNCTVWNEDEDQMIVKVDVDPA